MTRFSDIRVDAGGGLPAPPGQARPAARAVPVADAPEALRARQGQTIELAVVPPKTAGEGPALAIDGQVLDARAPQGLEVGDAVRARVVVDGERVLLELVGQRRGAAAAALAPTALERELGELQRQIADLARLIREASVGGPARLASETSSGAGVAQRLSLPAASGLLGVDDPARLADAVARLVQAQIEASSAVQGVGAVYSGAVVGAETPQGLAAVISAVQGALADAGAPGGSSAVESLARVLAALRIDGGVVGRGDPAALARSLGALADAAPQQMLQAIIDWAAAGRGAATGGAAGGEGAGVSGGQTASMVLLREALSELRQALAGEIPLRSEGLREALAEVLEQSARLLDSSAGRGERSAVESVIRRVIADLDGRPPGDVLETHRADLSRLIAGLEARVAAALSPEVGKRLSPEQLRALKGFETLVRGQEAVSRMAPLMRALGEPVFALFPGIAGGMLGRIELAYYPAGGVGRPGGGLNGAAEDGKDRIEEDESGRGAAASERFQRVRFRVTLGAIGEVEVDFAHSPGEALLEVRSEDQNICDFVGGRMPELRSGLAAIGFARTSLKVVRAAPRPVEPPWLQALGREALAEA